MNLYICATPIHFPGSEYGGQLVVMAESKKRILARSSRSITSVRQKGVTSTFPSQ